MSKCTAISDATHTSEVLTPASTPSESPSCTSAAAIASLRDVNMDEKPVRKPEAQDNEAGQKREPRHADEGLQNRQQEAADGLDIKKPKTSKKICIKPTHKKKKTARKADGKKASKDVSSSDSSSDEADSELESRSDSSWDERAKSKAKKAKQDKKCALTLEDSDSSESEDERPNKKSHSKKDKKEEKKRRRRRADTSVPESSDSSPSEEEELVKKKKKKEKKKRTTSEKSKKAAGSESDGCDSDASSESDGSSALKAQIEALQLQIAQRKVKGASRKEHSNKSKDATDSKKSSKSKSRSKKTFSAYQRVDQLWDNNTHNFTLKPSAEQEDDEYAEHAFLVRRCFTWENKSTGTVVDIKSKQLRSVLTVVMKDCKSVSLEAEEPSIDPNTLFLYLEELRTYYKKTLKAQIKAERKRKVIKKLEARRNLCKALVGYIDEDYADTKKTLYPLLEAGNITFDLIWALFKPDEVIVTSCYGSWEHPRCFKVDYATKSCSMQRGDWYCVEGKYLEYDGKAFGFGDFEIDIDGFKGPRKINSLAAYPLKYHRDPASIKSQILERGEKFVALDGMNYRFHKGLAFLKKKKTVAKINVNGRVMVDPATFRRINPNYSISWIKPKEDDDLFEIDGGDEDECSCCGEEDSETEGVHGDNKDLAQYNPTEDTPKYKYKWSTDNEGHSYSQEVEVDENGDAISKQKLETLSEKPDTSSKKFSEEELLLTSPVVLGFSFSDKLWLELSLSGISEIEYNEQAFDSLVLPDNQKDIVRALVESHKFNAAKTIDDVVQGKGKGLVSVLHGPPGTGKTLTAEGISELLKCPLYMVSAGELGTDPAKLEYELQKILDIAHSWGAVLLLDEADVFLEKREVHDIHRNALVACFLKLLEYFQGILFLTTNRVDTFDEAFQSRIHLPLRYGELSSKARKSIWWMFFEAVQKADPEGIVEFSDEELEGLSRCSLNGRQIKNCVRTAQALALRSGEKLGMVQVKKVLQVGESFERDLKGGTGYEDAMRSYT